ncbi:MAG: RNA recognition motif domain-containing protein [Planctomycetota bacterium]
MNIYVGNLSHDVSEDDLREAFGAFGEVESTNIVRDRFSGESRGFGFVIMPSKEEASAAVTGMNNKELKGRNVNVAEARPRAGGRRPGGGRGGFGGGGRGGGGRGGGRRGGFGGGSGRGRY